jgi:hypothetical protein
MQFQERVVGCFKALSTGDAIVSKRRRCPGPMLSGGIQAESRGSTASLEKSFPGMPANGTNGASARPRTIREQTLAVTRALLREGRVSHKAIGRELLQCKKSLHPGVSLWTLVQSGDPSRIASEGDGAGRRLLSAEQAG